MDKKITRANIISAVNSFFMILMGLVAIALIIAIFYIASRTTMHPAFVFYILFLLVLVLLIPTGIKLLKISMFSLKLNGIVLQYGYSDMLFSYLSIRIEREKSPTRRAYYQLVLAGALERGHRSEEALEVIKKIDYSCLRGMLCAEYYNCYAWIYLSMQDTENAERVLESGKFIIQPYRYNKVMGSAITHTLAVYDYSAGKFNSAETLLLEARNMAKFDTFITSCDLFLALIYLRTNRKELARDTAVKRIGLEGNPRNKEDLQKLMKKIERAFAEA